MRKWSYLVGSLWAQHKRMTIRELDHGAGSLPYYWGWYHANIYVWDISRTWFIFCTLDRTCQSFFQLSHNSVSKIGQNQPGRSHSQVLRGSLGPWTNSRRKSSPWDGWVSVPQLITIKLGDLRICILLPPTPWECLLTFSWKDWTSVFMPYLYNVLSHLILQHFDNVS